MRLIFLSPQFAGRTYELTVTHTTVGRGDQNTLAVHDPSVSDAHCEIFMNETDVIVRDLNSRNGTLVNGVRIQNQQHVLKPGQVVQFGSVAARLELPAGASLETRTDVTAVHSHARFANQPPPQPSNMAPPLEANPPAPMSDQTFFMPRPTEPVSPAVATPTTQASARPRSGFILAVGLGALLLLGLAWWLLTR